ncbi:MAG: glycoside hydrolase family 9 protein [Cyclobacteriaceae bacterium]|nr:glycoside hydrolase family 9 protein [Cyclobacteriaceae bacterium]
MKLSSTVLLLLLALYASAQTISRDIHFRINQLGYHPNENKMAIIFSESSVNEPFELVSDQGSVLVKIKPLKVEAIPWGKFNYYTIDFTQVQTAGLYSLRSAKSGFKSRSFTISTDNYQGTTDDLLTFMRQQRCGYNPFLDMVCHQRDGRIFYGNLPDSTFVDASGGWHDAGDQLKYLITGSYATAHMLMAYKLYPGKFSDKVNDLGQPFPNNIADVLDEAKWGLDWILKLHFAPDQLIHQIADDRDHIGWKMPEPDPSNFGWGPNSYRVAYVANGKPQGLNVYKSQATGYANVAGRSAAALALGAQIWIEIDASFAMQCFDAALSLYALGKTHEGFQQGNSYGAPYRYNEQTWADDMEWGAAELFRLTGMPEFLADAKRYATEANTDNWLMLDSASHYQYYPFINLGHYALYDLVDDGFKTTLAAYYKKK